MADSKLSVLDGFEAKVFKTNDQYKCRYKIEECVIFFSKKIDFNINNNINEFRKDVVLNSRKYMRIYGNVVIGKENCQTELYVSLYKFEIINYKSYYTVMGEAIVDEEGFFQFIIENYKKEDEYRVKISSSI